MKTLAFSDQELCDLVALNPGVKQFRDELRYRVRWQLIRKIPNPTGRCVHGFEIEWDMRGAYSSGYPIHVTGWGTTKQYGATCWEYKTIINDPPTEYASRLRRLADDLRP